MSDQKMEQSAMQSAACVVLSVETSNTNHSYLLQTCNRQTLCFQNIHMEAVRQGDYTYHASRFNPVHPESVS